MADNLLLPVTLDRVLDSNGDPVSGAKIHVYDAGTTDDKDVFTDDDLSTAAANPIVADSGGYVASRYIGTGAYKLVIKTSADVTIKTEDDLPGALDTSSFLTGSVTTDFNVIAKTSAYTVVSGDQNKVVGANPTGGAFAVTLPDATSVGDGWSVTVKHTGTANAITVETTSGQTIDAADTITLSWFGESITVASNGANWHVKDDARFVANALGLSMLNGVIKTTVSASALTVAIKTLNGTDPSNTDPVFILFREATLANGGYVRRRVTAATSVTVSSGSTLGTSNSVAFRLWVTAHDDGGTVRLGVSNRKTSTGITPLNEGSQVSTTAEGGAGAADAAGTIYTTSAATSKAMAVLGWAEWTSGLSTAGTWSAAADVVHLQTPGSKLPGDIVQTVQSVKSDTASGTTTTFGDTGLSVSITMTSTPNQALVSALVSGAGAASTDAAQIRLLRGATTVFVGDAVGNRAQVTVEVAAPNANRSASAAFSFLDSPATAGSLTYKVQAAESGNNTWYLNRAADDSDVIGRSRATSSLTAQEIMG